MSESLPPEFGINSWLEDELYQEYLHDRRTVDESWKKVFESNGEEAPAGGNGPRLQRRLVGHPVEPMGNPLLVPDRCRLADEHEEGRLKRILGVLRIAEETAADAPDG